MKINITKKSLCTAVLLLLSALAAQAQVTLSGTVTDSQSKETLAGVSIAVKGTVTGTITDTKGKFSLTVNRPAPFTLVITSVGYKTQEMEITGGRSDIDVTLEEQAIMGQEVVVSASRVEESVMQSPVTVEKLDLRAIRETPAPSFYDALANLKGIDMNTQSLTFRSVNMRGFNGNGQVRVVQMVDGMDNQAPGLNFSVGNIIGISDLDLDNVEVLPGAASALYGPNAINGIILMNSKSPFQYQGLSAQAKLGVMHVDNRQRAASPMYDFAIRYAKAFNNKFAFKVNFSYLAVQDWQAQDYRDQSVDPQNNLIGGTRQSNPAYNGINIYGDESSQNMQNVAQQMVAAGVLPSQALPIIPNTFVSRTGYTEQNLVDYGARNLKGNAALHYRLNEKMELIFHTNIGTGTTVYTGADRYNIRNFTVQQYKMELKGNNFFVRAYTTRENSGDTYAAGFLANLLNESWKPSQTWYPQYVGAFAAATAAGQNATQAHLTARGVADQGRPAPGSSEFDRFKNEIVGVPIGLGQGGRPLGGAGFRDRTNMYHAEFMYNFMDKIKFMELIVGGNFRQYDLNSGGTLFATQDGRPTGQEFNINEFGGYAQASKKLMNERLKLSASLRFDKSQNFDIQYSPRASAVYTFLDNHNIRASFQTGFRIPTTQAQYIDLITPQARLIGGLPFQREASATGYNFTNNPVYTIENVTAFGNAFRATATNPATQQQAVQQVLPQAQQLVTQQVQAGQIPNNPEAIAAAVQATVAQLAPQAVAAIALQANRNILQPVQFRPYQPERVQAYEIGYKGLISSKLFIDAYYYFNNYRNFDGGQVVIQSNVGLVADANQTRDKANRFTEPSAITPLGLIGLGGTQGQPTRSVYSLPINLQQDIRTSGWGIGVNYALPKNYTIGGNIANNTILNEGDLGSLQSFWNTPRYRANLQFGNREIVRNLGFNITWRWQDQTIWQGTFVQQVVSERRLSVVPGFHTFDAQVSYKISPIKSILKIGGSNIFNNYYTQAWGNPAVGGLYYISLTFDEFLN